MIPDEKIAEWKALAERLDDGDWTLHSGAILQLIAELDRIDDVLTHVCAAWRCRENPVSRAELAMRMDRLAKEVLDDIP